MFEQQDQLSAFIQSHGYKINEPIEFDGTWHEVKCSQTATKLRYIAIKNNKGNYRFTFGAFSWGDRFETWHSHKDVQLKTPEEKHQAKQEKLSKENSLSKTAELIFGEECREEVTGATYLSRKWPLGTLPLPTFRHNWKKDINHSFMLMVPMHDIGGKIWNVQSIQADGSKRNLGGKKAGLFLDVFAKPEIDLHTVYICEGLATAMTVSVAMSGWAICAFGIDNIPNILEIFKKREDKVRVIVVVDNDWEKTENAGELMWEKINKKYQGVSVAMPSITLLTSGSDYNDVLMLGGFDTPEEALSEIKKDIEKQIGPEPLNEKEIDEILTEATEKLEKPDYTGEIPLHDPMHTPKIQTKHDKNGIFVGDIASFDSGFHVTVYKGQTPIKVPDYSGLRLYFERIHNYRILGESKECMVWNGTHYEYMQDVYIESFAQKHLFPTAKNNMVSEFVKLVLRTNVTPISFFTQKTQRKMNFKNGYYDIDTQKLEPANKEIGFRYVLPYNFDPNATAPQFEAFMKRITVGDAPLANLILEYCGYAISGDSCWAQKCMILTGEGSNGKSTFVNTIRAVFGELNTAAVSANKFSDGNALALMDGKLINIAEESPKKAFNDSDVFKNLVTGGIVAAKKLYKNLYEVRMTTKLLMLCNNIPSSYDSSHGFYRRLIIVPFNATFTDTDKDFDPFIEQKLLTELPGIANLVLRAYVALKARGRFDIPDSSKNALNQYKLEGDPVALWKETALEVHPLGNGHDKDFVTNPTMYKLYSEYCQTNGYKSTNPNNFGKQLKRLIPDYEIRQFFHTTTDSKDRALRAVTRPNGKHYARLGNSDSLVPKNSLVPENRLESHDGTF